MGAKFPVSMDSRRVGILGGGQLGRMVAEAGHKLGIEVAILDPGGATSPAGQVVRPGLALEGSFQDKAMIEQLAQMCDVLTVEIEHVNCDALLAIEQAGTVVSPSSATIRLIQDKLTQKEAFTATGMPTPEYRGVESVEEARACGVDFGYPFMLKARKGAYDGRGNFAVHAEADLEKAWQTLGGDAEKTSSWSGLYIEKWCQFDKELAVMVARNSKGEMATYPVVETLQENSICSKTICPPNVPADVLSEAAEVATRAVLEALPEGAIGIFGVELFWSAGCPVLLNEIAPRPHNSGHYTIEACGTCQFEMHLRAVLDLPMSGTEMIVGCSVMQNTLGRETLQETMAPLHKCLEVGGVGNHWYAKAGNVKPGRKMGHFTVCGSSARDVADKLRQICGEDPEIATLCGTENLAEVAVIMGSDSDLPTMSAACKILERFGIAFECSIVSAHRTPHRMVEFATSAEARGLKVIIAGAGGAAHLPGMVAALTPLPVVGVPIRTSALSGVDSLHSIVQMPGGVPVATVAIGNATNAGLLAVRMLACAGKGDLLSQLKSYAKEQETTVLDKVGRLEDQGYEEYLQGMANQSKVVM